MVNRNGEQWKKYSYEMNLTDCRLQIAPTDIIGRLEEQLPFCTSKDDWPVTEHHIRSGTFDCGCWRLSK